MLTQKKERRIHAMITLIALSMPMTLREAIDVPKIKRYDFNYF